MSCDAAQEAGAALAQPLQLSQPFITSVGENSFTKSFQLEQIGTGNRYSYGVDQSFAAGYKENKYASDFHQTQIKPRESLFTGEDTTRWMFYKNFGTSVHYDSNLYSSLRHNKEDVIFAYVPEVGIGLFNRRTYLQTFYDMSYVQYINHDTLNNFNHLFTTRGAYETSRFHVDLLNIFRPNSFNAIGNREELRRTSLDTLVKTHFESLELVARYDVSAKTTVQLGQKYEIELMPSNKIYSYQFYSVTPGVIHEITPKTSAISEFDFRTTVYPQKGWFASKSYRPTTGLVWNLTQKTQLIARGGYHWITFNEPEIGDGNGWQYEAVVSYWFTPKILGSLWTSHDIQTNLGSVSDQSFVENVDYYGTKLTAKLTPWQTLSTDGRVGFGSRKGYVTYADPDYPDNLQTFAQDEVYYEWNLNWEYAFKNDFSLMVGYGYFNKDSPFNRFDYDNHRAFSSVNWKF